MALPWISHGSRSSLTSPNGNHGNADRGLPVVMLASGTLRWSCFLTVKLTVHQSELSAVKRLKLYSPVRWSFSNLFLCHLHVDRIGFFPPSLLLSPAQSRQNCNFQTVWCKYRYCRRHNQTFMTERDLGRGSESRSWMCLQLCQTAALLSTPFSPLKPPLCPPLLSLSSLILSSHLYSFSFSPTSHRLYSSSITCIWTFANIFPMKPKPGILHTFYLSKIETTTRKPSVPALLTIISQGEGHISILTANCDVRSKASEQHISRWWPCERIHGI